MGSLGAVIDVAAAHVLLFFFESGEFAFLKRVRKIGSRGKPFSEGVFFAN